MADLTQEQLLGYADRAIEALESDGHVCTTNGYRCTCRWSLVFGRSLSVSRKRPPFSQTWKMNQSESLKIAWTLSDMSKGISNG
jgi:hypothetical protein